MTADADVLGGIHRQLAETYARLVSPRQEIIMVKGEPVLDDEGNPRTHTVYPSAAELAAANAFLKQNNITASPKTDQGLQELEAQLARRARRKVLPDLVADPEADPLGGMH